MTDYTFRLACSFFVQHTFTDTEVDLTDPTIPVPTESAVGALQDELEVLLSSVTLDSDVALDVEAGWVIGIDGVARHSRPPQEG